MDSGKVRCDCCTKQMVTIQCLDYWIWRCSMWWG